MPLGAGAVGTPVSALRRGQVAHTAENPIEDLKAQIATEPLALVALFVSAEADFDKTIAEAQEQFAGTDVVACTTAGEIGMSGYENGLIVGIGFPAAHFVSTSILIEDLKNESSQVLVDRIALSQVAMRDANPRMQQGFAFLVVDGLSLREDTLTAAIAPALRDLPLFGGSAGDGTTFERTLVSLNGRVRNDAAVLTLVLTDYRTRVFSIDHLVPTDAQMVVTEADPARRIVKSINAEPAAREYARIVGKDPEQLDQFTFASHPVVVRFGGTHHVRAIQQVNDNGELVFFSAIDEGMVLTVARPDNMAAHLERKLQDLGRGGRPADILGCDCILRRIEAEQTQLTHRISQILRDHRVTGFSTYGEQIGTLHVNHTMTGVAIYADEPED
ncbi:FIST N-terminal domain-containing protein [Sulfitobacter sabulilitoris]|uniref:GfdT protein n=1 Tax=Sulfitobacter sabulilitoris TaxID=2562655 RepID=A0A5S3PC02_9RHOB|nr:FIST N-terminal domain-containing protein [Sulfitobacter sabulilitoris]TMM51230.1 GfdT protein [Sulfitobacter sabulilitoris]